jgi:PAS domain S-box-containing protein
MEQGQGAHQAAKDGCTAPRRVLRAELLQSMLDATHDLIYAKDADGLYLACNEASERLVGLPEAEQIGKTDHDFFPPEFAQAVLEDDRAIMATGQERRVEAWVTYPDGSRVLLESVKTPFYGPDGKVAGIVGVSRDITLRKQAEEKLASALAFFDLVVSEAPIGIAVYAAESGRCQKVNQAVCEIIGATPEEMSAQNFREIASWRESGMLAAAEAALVSGETQQLNVSATTTFGRRMWVLAVFSSLRSEAGLHLLVLLKDITDRKLAEAEQKKLQVEVAHLQRLESLGQLAGGVAHEINNVLASIMAASEVMLMRGGEAAPLAELILQSTRHGRDIVRALIDFSRKDLTTTALLDLNEVVRSQAQLLSNTTRQRVRIEEALEEVLPRILAEPAALAGAVLNLCLNAVDAMPEGGVLTLRTLKTSLGGVQLCVEDTGQGMTEQVRLRAMEPFFTTKPFGKGAGLGLSMVFGLVHAHGGTIEIESSLGVGTRVLLTFPAAVEPGLHPPGPTVPSVAAPAKLRRILLVDDDALVRESIPILLGSMGHQVEVASGGAEALRRLAAGAAVDCVILDLNMPGLSGEETLLHLRESHPGLPVIIGSGEMDPERSEHLLVLPGVTLLPKPYGFLDLEAALRRLD